ncbi:MAG TPA: hypothetical protein VNS32_11360 [Flavisolibacter sp.]|nr:hypothetical protein [Flavisolibacter sp.]
MKKDKKGNDGLKSRFQENTAKKRLNKKQKLTWTLHDKLFVAFMITLVVFMLVCVLGSIYVYYVDLQKSKF